MTAVLVEEGPDAGAVWHLGQPSQESRALHEGTGWADLGHLEIVRITGADRLTWLHSLTTQFLENLAPNVYMDVLILDPRGHIEHQFVMVDDGESSWLILDPGRAATLIIHLQKMKFMMRVEVQDVSAEYAVLRLPGESDDVGGPYKIITRAELEKWRSELNTTAREVGMWAIEAERVAQGRPRIGFETDHKSIPNELGLLNKAVHMNKGCYRGQETVAKVANLGSPPRRLVLLHLDGSVVTIPSTGSAVERDEVKVGFIGTVARHYELGTIALAVVKRNTPLDAQLTIEGIPATQEEIK
ncbi:MAG: folate-binding protein YgfZ [Actinobacteria bacterium]|nr:folate-binding protein YgfZ [Actinomycetota bacterium]